MAFTKAQLEALKNTLLASNQPILASQHRQQIQSIIDEMYDAQSRANILVGVQSDTVQGGSDTFLVFRSGQAYQLPVSLVNANDLANLGDVFINNLEDGDSLVYDAVADRWENRSILLGFALANLTDVELTSLAGGDILRYDSGDDLWENVSLASLLAPYVTLNTAQTITGVKTFDTGLVIISQGTSNNTILRNASGNIFITNQNVFGFNGSNNIYFGKGITNVGILAFDNTATRTYTLQNASGTLAFTSDITTALNDFVTLDTFQIITAQKNFNSTIVANTNIQLATKGTALTTFLQNISGTQISTSGANAFGFNNANNIYFAGSAKAGGIFAFDNSTFRTYTLQDASGTLAFLSDIPTIPADNVTGTGTAGQVSFWTGANTQGGDSRFVWDNAQKQLRVITENSTTDLTLNSVFGNSGSVNGGEYGIALSTNTTGTRGVYLTARRLSGGGASDFNIYTSLGGEIPSLKWTVRDTGILQSNGAQTIQTSTGNLTLATAGGNGNILISPNGSGDLRIPSVLRQNDGTGTQAIVLESSTSVVRLRTGTSVTTKDIAIQAGANDVITVKGAGNVGIGTTTPSAKLDISGVLRIGRTNNITGISVGSTVPIFTGVSNSIYLILVTRSLSLSRMRYGIFIPSQGFVQQASSSVPQFTLSVSGNNLEYTQDVTAGDVQITVIQISNI